MFATLTSSVSSAAVRRGVAMLCAFAVLMLAFHHCGDVYQMSSGTELSWSVNADTGSDGAGSEPGLPSGHCHGCVTTAVSLDQPSADIVVKARAVPAHPPYVSPSPSRSDDRPPKA